jgi:sugar phosphate isomerase/epimerase
MLDLKRHVHVNVPFRMLLDAYLPRFIENGLNPEIGFDAEALECHSRREFQSVSEKLRDHGLSVTIHFPFLDLSPGSPEPAVRELAARRFDQTLPLISLFRPKAAVCHTGYDPRRYGFMRETWLRNSLAFWPGPARKIREEGCLLVLENVYEDGPSDILDLLEGLSPWGVGFCLDTGHQAAFGKTPLDRWIGSTFHHLRHVHLHDNRGERDDHLALGEGSIDLGLFFQEMKKHFPSPPLITLEPHREEDVGPSLRFLERCWPW